MKLPDLERKPLETRTDSERLYSSSSTSSSYVMYYAFTDLFGPRLIVSSKFSQVVFVDFIKLKSYPTELCHISLMYIINI